MVNISSTVLDIFSAILNKALVVGADIKDSNGRSKKLRKLLTNDADMGGYADLFDFDSSDEEA